MNLYKLNKVIASTAEMHGVLQSTVDINSIEYDEKTSCLRISTTSPKFGIISVIQEYPAKGEK
ncbi:hypothetical protein ABQD61_12835 [Enterococcus asini]|uniref:hypothetical protein n=1 Tax=Enterococcus asini TaxID=57732 RepID=UPI0032E3B1C6